MKITSKDALIIVDVQNDFCSGGALPVPNGERIIPILNQYIERFQKAGAKIVATRDWHPSNHFSFKEYGGPWPSHCVQQTWGAKFHKDLKLPKNARIVSKAYTQDKEAYSGFEGTDLANILHTWGVKRVFIGGLATDYCVLNTVLDALSHGFEAHLLLDACEGIDVTPGDIDKAVGRMIRQGAKPHRLKDLTEVVEEVAV